MRADIEIALKYLNEELGDTEMYHVRYDEIIFARLEQLDPEFTKALSDEAKGKTFWYA